MTDEIIIPRDELAANIRIWLRVARQKQPHLLRNLASLRNDRGFPDRRREDDALAAFAEYLADKFQISGKRIVRDRAASLAGIPEVTAAEIKAGGT